MTLAALRLAARAAVALVLCTGAVRAEGCRLALLMALALGYAVLLRLFGGLVATVIFLAVALSLLNRGKPLKNALISVLVPAFVYLLFDRILNANMPPALIDLPI